MNKIFNDSMTNNVKTFDMHIMDENDKALLLLKSISKDNIIFTNKDGDMYLTVSGKKSYLELHTEIENLNARKIIFIGDYYNKNKDKIIAHLSIDLPKIEILTKTNFVESIINLKFKVYPYNKEGDIGNTIVTEL